jgi:hypothetical protein
VNVAGTSKYLDPDGGDVFGLNNVLGEFLNAGYFDTPYVDGDVRLSRTSGPASEQLRVFVRVGSALLAPSSNGDDDDDDDDDDDAGGTTAAAAVIDGVREAGATGDADVAAAAATDDVASVDAGDDGSVVVEGVASEDPDDGNGVVDVASEDAGDESVDDGVVAAAKIEEIVGAEADEEDNAPEVISEAPPAAVEIASATGVDEVDEKE